MINIASVSFLNATPLNCGLETQPGVRLHLDVPARLLGGLSDGRYDVALLPVIDYQRWPGLRLIPAGGIASDGPTLTVRIFSRVPIEKIHALACDTDSHTSVALARVILSESYGRHPELCSLRAADGFAEVRDAMLLIGDKVVCHPPLDDAFPYQLDLGEAWKELTGLPFVFAAWMARAGVELGTLPELLAESRVAGLRQIERIIEREAPRRGWPIDVARRYLTKHLEYEITPRHIEAIERFHALAAELGVIEKPPAPLRLA